MRQLAEFRCDSWPNFDATVGRILMRQLAEFHLVIRHVSTTLASLHNYGSILFLLYRAIIIVNHKPLTMNHHCHWFFLQ